MKKIITFAITLAVLFGADPTFAASSSSGKSGKGMSYSAKSVKGSKSSGYSSKGGKGYDCGSFSYSFSYSVSYSERAERVERVEERAQKET